MNIVTGFGKVQVVTIGLQPGELLLESIETALKEKEIRDGVVISGIGTLKNLRMHYITGIDPPPKDEIVNIERPLELLSVSGIIADGEAHLHVVVSCKQEEMFGGHLEHGSKVAYLAEIAILRCDDLEITRKLDEQRRIKLLASR
jgi:predicted DNA-binding protein with PD1-like motif